MLESMDPGPPGPRRGFPTVSILQPSEVCGLEPDTFIFVLKEQDMAKRSRKAHRIQSWLRQKACFDL